MELPNHVLDRAWFRRSLCGGGAPFHFIQAHQEAAPYPAVPVYGSYGFFKVPALLDWASLDLLELFMPSHCTWGTSSPALLGALASSRWH